MTIIRSTSLFFFPDYDLSDKIAISDIKQTAGLFLDFTSAGQQAWGTGATSNQGDGQQESERKKKRKSRWAQETELEKTIIPGMPTVIPTGLSMDQEKQYLCKFN